MKIIVTVIFFFTMLLACKQTQTIVNTSVVEPSKKRPNILFISIDDLTTTLGCYGDTSIITPRIDKLASQGTVFLNNHCQQALCGPSRASVLSGLRPDNGRIWELFTKVREANPDMISLPQHLKSNGYITGGSGKVYDGSTVDSLRDSLSWSIPFVKPKGTRWIENNDITGASNKKNVPYEAPDRPESEFLDAMIVDEGISLMQQMSKEDKSFFLAVGIKKPHLPFVAPKKYWDMYDQEKIKIAEIQEWPESIPSFHFQPSWELRSGYAPIPKEDPLPVDLQKNLRHGYYACVTHADHQVGRLLDELDLLKIRDNTIVVLWSDHGYHLGDHMMWNKFCNIEQSTAAPMIISAPGYSLNNKTTHPTELVDIYPTLCDLVGISTPYKMGGKSLTTVLKHGETAAKKYAMTQYHRTSNGIKLEGYSIRTDRYRYTEWLNKMYKSTNEKYDKNNVVAREFYDYQTSPTEDKNLIDNPKYSNEIAQHSKYMETYFRDMGR